MSSAFLNAMVKSNTKSDTKADESKVKKPTLSARQLQNQKKEEAEHANDEKTRRRWCNQMA
jgi:hypothetical protein